MDKPQDQLQKSADALRAALISLGDLHAALLTLQSELIDLECRVGSPRAREAAMAMLKAIEAGRSGQVCGDTESAGKR